jgi:hypothetical protein
MSRQHRVHATIVAALVAGLGGATLTRAKAPAQIISGAEDLRLVGQIGGTPHDLVADDKHVYQAIGRTVAVAERRPGGELLHVGITPPLPEEALGLAMLGGTVAVADGSAGLWLVDVADPSRPILRGGIDTPGMALDVALTGGIAYVADGVAGGLRLFDVTDMDAPRPLGRIDTPGDARAVSVRDGFAFVADGQLGLFVVDVSDPNRPLPGASVPSGIHVAALALTGEVAVVADPAFGLRWLSIADPHNVTEVGALHLTNPPQMVVALGDRAYAITATGDRKSTELVVVDFPDPRAPRIFETFNTIPSAGLALTGDRLLVANFDANAAIVTVRLAVQPSKSQLETWSLPSTVKSFPSATGPHLVGLRSQFYMWSVDLTDPARPAHPNLVTGGDAVMAVQGPYAFVGHSVLQSRPDHPYLAAVTVFDVSGPLKREIGSTKFSDFWFKPPTAIVQGDYFYLADGNVLSTVMIRPPNNPNPVAELRLPSQPQAMVMSDQRMVIGMGNGPPFIGDGPLGLVTLSAAGRPEGLSLLPERFRRGDSLAMTGSLAFVATGVGVTRTIRLLDVSDVSRPMWRGSLSGKFGAMAVGRDRAYLAEGFDVVVVDTHDPDRPVELSRVPLRHMPRALQLQGRRLLIGTNEDGLLVYEIVPPAPPSPTATELPTPSAPTPEPSPTMDPPTPTATRRRVLLSVFLPLLMRSDLDLP